MKPGDNGYKNLIAPNSEKPNTTPVFTYKQQNKQNHSWNREIIMWITSQRTMEKQTRRNQSKILEIQKAIIPTTDTVETRSQIVKTKRILKTADVTRV